MNIWIIDHYSVPPKYYPLARQTMFAKYLMKMGHDVKIIAASTVHNSTVNLLEKGERYKTVVENGVTYVLIRCREYTGNGVRRVLNMLEFAQKLPRVCAELDRPDVIVSTSMTPFACAAGLKIAMRYGSKKIAQISDLWPESIVAFGIAGPHHPAVLLLRRLEKWIYLKADAVVFTMEGAYDYIVEQGWEKQIPRSKVYHINNGVDLEAFDYNRAHFQIEDNDLDDPDIFKVIYTGSIRRVNNLGVLLETAKKISATNIRFLIWGAGDELDELKQRVVDENITNVRFKGSVEKKYIPYILDRADLTLVHWGEAPLLRYGVSYNKLFDYLAAGHPIYSTVKPGYSILERYGCGKDAAESDPLCFAHDIEEIAAMPPEELSKLGRNARTAAEDYDFRQLTEKLVHVIEEVNK